MRARARSQRIFCGEKVWDRELSLNGVTRPPRRNGWGSANNKGKKGKIFFFFAKKKNFGKRNSLVISIFRCRLTHLKKKLLKHTLTQTHSTRTRTNRIYAIRFRFLKSYKFYSISILIFISRSPLKKSSLAQLLYKVF